MSLFGQPLAHQREHLALARRELHRRTRSLRRGEHLLRGLGRSGDSPRAAAWTPRMELVGLARPSAGSRSRRRRARRGCARASENEVSTTTSRVRAGGRSIRVSPRRRPSRASRGPSARRRAASSASARAPPRRSAAVPTTSMPSAPRAARARPARTSAWSSTIITRITGPAPPRAAACPRSGREPSSRLPPDVHEQVAQQVRGRSGPRAARRRRPPGSSPRPSSSTSSDRVVRRRATRRITAWVACACLTTLRAPPARGPVDERLGIAREPARRAPSPRARPRPGARAERDVGERRAQVAAVQAARIEVDEQRAQLARCSRAARWRPRA